MTVAPRPTPTRRSNQGFQAFRKLSLESVFQTFSLKLSLEKGWSDTLIHTRMEAIEKDQMPKFNKIWQLWIKH